ncbi:MAG TPA: CRISPR-associated helicase Cas3' [Actinobacteria bacterium]|jgi:CRISPR-associated endonuclease/helicase Cas3|nr:CRISPR-associated helicase Cas3' [Actinomycetota bacterium]
MDSSKYGKIYYAHSLKGRPSCEWQKLKDHLRNVAKLARKFAESFGGGDWAELAGWMHDIGKYSQEFQDMLIKTTDNNINAEAKISHPDHSTAGAQEINKLFSNGFGKLLAYTVAGHHSGLLDGKSNEACLDDRLKKKNIPDYSAYLTEMLEFNSNIKSLPFNLAKGNNERIAFQLQLFVRMIFSCLVDADYLDTEAFMSKDTALLRGSCIKLPEMNLKLNKALDDISSRAPDTLINKYRKDILKQCIAAADNMPGLFSLTVPTGGGKTLSSLAFAVKHALKYGMNRIIYVIPYTSIIEQNADIFRKIFGNEAVLEHHSNIKINDDDYKFQLAIENWDASLIVTTNVQFFESLFHNRTSKCRRIHNIANSIVILDEAQMLPIHLLKPCIEILRQLTDSYKTTIVLCTATQPALLKNDEFVNGLENVSEIISDPERLYKNFRRVEINYLSKKQQKTTDKELIKKILGFKQVLCVVNTRCHARELYEQIDDKDGLYHLSALMCPIHRSEIIQKIKDDLKSNKKCRVVSTQLIEAGVDIDFPVVFRSIAGIDSIAQSAGRCNREGSLPIGKVYVFYPEKTLPVGFLRQGAEEANAIMRKYSDILSMEAINEYFRNLYWINEDKLDKGKILEKLSEEVGSINFPFREITEDFKIIDKDMESVIIPYNDDAKRIIKQLRYAEFTKKLARKAQRFSVQIYPQILRKLENISIERIRDNFLVLINEDLYRKDIGLNYDDPVFREAENNIF